MVKCERCGGQMIKSVMRALQTLAGREEYLTCVQCGREEYFEARGGKMEPVFTMRDSDEAFEDALAAGVLSFNEEDRNWVGHYMYMVTASGIDSFKHRDTRQYLNHDTAPASRNARPPQPQGSKQ
jgi:hypothetical protein